MCDYKCHGYVFISEMGLKRRNKKRITENTEHNTYLLFVCLFTVRRSNQLPEYGSYVVQYIVEVFDHCAHEDHIEELFRKVSFSSGSCYK